MGKKDRPAVAPAQASQYKTGGVEMRKRWNWMSAVRDTGAVNLSRYERRVLNQRFSTAISDPKGALIVAASKHKEAKK